MKRCSVVLMMTMSLSGCGSAHDTDPVTVATPGLPSPEKALQESLDRVHAFMASLNDRLDKHVPINIPQVQTNLTVAASSPIPPQPSVQSDPTHRVAVPLPGKGGVTWFGFGDGTPTINCQHPAICLIRFEAGETMQESQITLSDRTNWHSDLVRGTQGIHAGWAVAIEPGPQADQAQLSLQTSRRTYNIQLVANTPSMPIVAFTHTPTEPLSQPPFPTTNSLAAYGRSNPDFRYTLSGETPPWTPLRVYRDAGHTFIDFPQGQIVTHPQLVILAPHVTQPDAYHVAGDSYVIDAVINDLQLIGTETAHPTVRATYGTRP